MGKKERRRIKSRDNIHRRPPSCPSYITSERGPQRWRERLIKKKKKEALKKQAVLLSAYTKAERAFEKILQDIAIDYEREYIVMLYDFSVRFIDFYSHSAKVGFEVDGGYHKDRVEYDIDRDIGIMAAKNILMVRLTNEDVLNDPEGTKDKVVQTLWARVEWWKQFCDQSHRMGEWTSKQKQQ